MAKKYFIIIPADTNPDNAKNDQFHYYQQDGKTVRVAVGQQQEVPEWVAKRAKEIGDIQDFIVVND